MPCTLFVLRVLPIIMSVSICVFQPPSFTPFSAVLLLIISAFECLSDGSKQCLPKTGLIAERAQMGLIENMALFNQNPFIKKMLLLLGFF